MKSGSHRHHQMLGLFPGDTFTAAVFSLSCPWGILPLASEMCAQVTLGQVIDFAEHATSLP